MVVLQFFFEIVNYAILHQETRCRGEGKYRNIKNSLSSLSCLDIILYGAELLKHCVTFLRGPYSLLKGTTKKIFLAVIPNPVFEKNPYYHY